MPFLELTQFQATHQYPLKTYMADMFDMQKSLNPKDLSVTAIKTAKQLRKYHDTLARLANPREFCLLILMRILSFRSLLLQIQLG